MEKIFIKLVVIFGLIIVLFGFSNILIDNALAELEQREIQKGDIVSLKGGSSSHVIMYIGKGSDGQHRFIESAGKVGVYIKTPIEIVEDYPDINNYKYYCVKDNGGNILEEVEKEPAVSWAKEIDKNLLSRYQWLNTGRINHYNINDEIKQEHTDNDFCEPYHKFFPYLNNIKNDKIRHSLAYILLRVYHLKSFSCAELIWAAYMNLPTIDNKQINICHGSNQRESYYGLGESSYTNCMPGPLTHEDNTNVEAYECLNSPFTEIGLTIKGFVNGNLDEDDPENYTWTTIQKGIDNLSTLDTLYIYNGTYTEKINVNKSMYIVGESKENVTIYGSFNIISDLDYELPDYCDDSIIVNINMKDIEVLYHFNNDSEIGENYSNSNVVFDYSGQGNNGTNNGAIWTTNALKGNGTFDFDGINDYVNHTGISTFTRENLTVSSWIYWKGGSSNKDPIVTQCNTTHGYCLYVNSSSNKPIFRLDDSEAVSSINISNGWHHIVGTHNETTLNVYVDGILVGTGQKTGSGIDSEFYVGFDNISNYYNGSIDEVAIWNRTFIDSEISVMYRANYGTVLDNFTMKNGKIGLKLDNGSQLLDIDIFNYSIGIQMENLSRTCVIRCNISDCDTAIKLNNSTIEENIYLSIGDNNIENCTNGMIINSSTNIKIFGNYLNCSNIDLKLNFCNIKNIIVDNCTSPGNVAPDKPDTPSGIILGDPYTKYYYKSVTNDSNDDQIYYQFYWDDGNITEWLGPYSSNETITVNHTWSEEGGYYVYVFARDVLNSKSDWSEPLLFKTETLPPLINRVCHTPYIAGLGDNVTISVNATDDQSGNYSGVDYVKVNITFPDETTGNYTIYEDGTGDSGMYTYHFTDTWTVGQYNYSIWVVDNAYNINCSMGYSFNVSAQASIDVCTIKDDYGNQEWVNLTDPPTSTQIGYKLLDDGKILHIWNRYDSYYFNTSNGLQFSNHYNEYWSTNVLMLGYYNNDVWNLIYRVDELSGFNKDIEFDGKSFVNVTLWKNLSYSGYDFRLAIRYHLGVDDNDLTVIPYIKNIDEESIPYNLGFAWELKDIQVDNTPNGDYIEIDDQWYYLNNSGIDETYTNLDQSCYYIRENKTGNTFESLYLKWDGSLNYKLKVKSRTGQYNAPITLGIKIGTLDIGQEKYTSLFWHDASEATFYFNDYVVMAEEWATNPSYMVDGITSNYASTFIDGDVELCNNNTCDGEDLGIISKVELRCYGYYSSGQRDIILRPIFGGKDGDNHNFVTTTSAGWSQWFDITSDTNAPPGLWTWNDVKDLDCDVEAESDIGMFTLYCSKVEIRITYTVNSAPNISSPYPSDGSSGIGISPLLNITVSDPEGSNMNITWLSNSSGSWQVFGTNSSVGNGTYHQIMSNASVNGQWWYWKVNVSDGSNTSISDVYKFYTGVQSKIENTGITNITGYLLIQVHFWNTTLEIWEPVSDTINETSSRTINSGDTLALDTIFNGNVETATLLTICGNGSYRIYAMFRDPDGDVLMCDDDTELIATYEFSITFD
jgi:hypothetical protein